MQKGKVQKGKVQKGKVQKGKVQKGSARKERNSACGIEGERVERERPQGARRGERVVCTFLCCYIGYVEDRFILYCPKYEISLKKREWGRALCRPCSPFDPLQRGIILSYSIFDREMDAPEADAASTRPYEERHASDYVGFNAQSPTPTEKPCVSPIDITL